MNIYKITKGNRSHHVEYETIEEANTFAASLSGEGWVVTLEQENIPQPTEDEVIEYRIMAGNQIALKLNVDVLKGNGKINPNLSTIMSHLQFGEFDDAKTAINQINTAIMSQALKDKYIAMIDAV